MTSSKDSPSFLSELSFIQFVSVTFMLVVLFCVLWGRLFQLQVFRGTTYRERSEQNRVRQVPIVANRGILFDRHERVLVDNRPSYSLFLIPYEFQKVELDLGVLDDEETEDPNDISGMADEEVPETEDDVEGGDDENL